ncbi:hypothetical protein [Lysinibacillus sp. OF-1]|uniref:hypothetical protein n=1 Tax=Lysinibacillus sp. OF-1 TaxID=2972483 RepID=UPI00232E1822|nr:hypothetical protein [Lysinibacillus sp. OF-1]WCH47031.1 hypothetical protein NV349_18615 [Lysinibacillus sp. OF-1]
MNNEKFTSKLKKFIDYLKEGEPKEHSEQNNFAIQIGIKKSHLFGYSDNPLPLNCGIILMEYKNEIIILGHLDQKKFLSNNNENFKVIIASDDRKNDNPKLYVNTPEKNYYIDKDTLLSDNEKIYIYWQYGKDNCLSIIYRDQAQSETRYEHLYYVSDESMNPLKIITYHILQYLEDKQQIKDVGFDEE